MVSHWPDVFIFFLLLGLEYKHWFYFEIFPWGIAQIFVVSYWNLIWLITMSHTFGQTPKCSEALKWGRAKISANNLTEKLCFKFGLLYSFVDWILLQVHMANRQIEIDSWISNHKGFGWHLPRCFFTSLNWFQRFTVHDGFHEGPCAV